MLFLHKVAQVLKQKSAQHNFITQMIFDKDLEDKPIQDELPYVEIKNQMSTVYTNGRNTPCSSFTPLFSYSPFENPQILFETSLDTELYRHNANLVRRGIVTFLKYCLNCPIDDARIFHDGNIFCFEGEGFNYEQQELLDGLITYNHILSPWKKKQVANVFEQYRDLKGVFREIKELCGRSITQELIYIFSEVVDHKLKKIQELQVCQIDEVVPRMERFWGDENDERIIRGGWNVYNEVDYDRVKLLAASDSDVLGSSIYFSNKLKYLVLASISSEVIAEVNLMDKFTTLVTFIAEALLLSMQGISQKEEDFEAFALDLHYTTAVDGNVQEHSSKKIKGDDL